MKTLKDILPDYIRACFTGIWIKTYEPDEAIDELTKLCMAENWNIATWDLDRGYSGTSAKASDPRTAVREMASLGDNETPQLVVLRHFHRFLGAFEVVQSVERQILAGRQTRVFLIVLSPVVHIPVELEKLFTVIDHQLPDREQLLSLAAKANGGPLPNEANTQRVLDAAAGMTRLEADDAFSLSIIKHDRLVPESIMELKEKLLRESSALQIYSGEIPSLGGLDNLTHFCRQVLSPSTSGDTEHAKGVMLLGVSGSGKSAFAKWLGHAVGRPTLILDIGALMGSLVGQTEEALRKALAQIDAMSPCVVMIDEVEKAISTNGNDSGVSRRMLGTLLTWFNDRPSDSFVICTANDISMLPPEFTRAERFDGIFFVDLPDKATRDQIWAIYERHYRLEKPKRPDCTDWTGAEIKACCRLTHKCHIPLVDAAQYIVPVTHTASESIAQLRQWATGRCLDAARPGIYGLNHTTTPVPRRNLKRDALFTTIET
jgi:hypothetical protein